MVVQNVRFQRLGSTKTHDCLSTFKADVAHGSMHIQLAVFWIYAVFKCVPAVNRLELATHNRITALSPRPFRLSIVRQIRIFTNANAKMPDPQSGDPRSPPCIIHPDVCRNWQLPGIECAVAVNQIGRFKQIERDMHGQLLLAQRRTSGKPHILPRGLFSVRVANCSGKKEN